MLIQSSMFDNVNFFPPLADRMRPRALQQAVAAYPGSSLYWNA